MRSELILLLLLLCLKIKPGVGTHKVTIEGCREGLNYSIILVAESRDGSSPLISNELEVMLPVDLDEITLPDPSLRKLENDYYDEYIEIVETDDVKHIKRISKISFIFLLPLSSISLYDYEIYQKIITNDQLILLMMFLYLILLLIQITNRIQLMMIMMIRFDSALFSLFIVLLGI